MPIMVRLEKIKMGDKTAEADFFPEDSKVCGHVKVDLGTEEYVETVSVDGYDLGYANHAARELVRISKESGIPESRIVMWY